MPSTYKRKKLLDIQEEPRAEEMEMRTPPSSSLSTWGRGACGRHHLPAPPAPPNEPATQQLSSAVTALCLGVLTTLSSYLTVLFCGLCSVYSSSSHTVMGL